MRIEVHSELKNFDGLWFPGRVTILKDGEVDSEVFVTHVEVGSPKDDAGIPFDDLELFEGVQLVTLQLADSTVPGRESWTGEKFVSFSDWLKHYPQDEWQERLDFLEQNEYGAYSNPDHVRIIDSQVKEAPKLWAEYVAFFVRKNGLTGQKAEKAWQLLKELQKPAYKYLDDKSLELARVEREEDPDKRQTLKGHLLGPITVIFERQLVPGLEQIVKHR
jgi:hypothetical protein